MEVIVRTCSENDGKGDQCVTAETIRAAGGALQHLSDDESRVLCRTSESADGSSVRIQANHGGAASRKRFSDLAAHRMRPPQNVRLTINRGVAASSSIRAKERMARPRKCGGNAATALAGAWS